MRIINNNSVSIKNNKNINSKFIYTKYDKLNLKCNILTGNFFVDTYNYFPITDELYSFSEIYSWGDKIKYENFYSDNFIKNFEKNLKSFKSFSDVFVLGSSSQDNYYRNIITFLPRLFYHSKNKIKLGIHRSSSNKFRKFIKLLCDQMKIKISFLYLDDGFFKFVNSEIPQFINKNQSIKILNKLSKDSQLPKNKIYISRQNCSYRNLINEQDVILKLKKSGFEIFNLNNMDILKQIELFSNAEIIVSPTGSSLANIVFCKEGTKIYEISPKYSLAYEDLFKIRYSSIAKVLNLNYNRIEADSIDVKEIKNTTKIISSKVIKESNYYKNLLVKLEMIDKLIKD